MLRDLLKTATLGLLLVTAAKAQPTEPTDPPAEPGDEAPAVETDPVEKLAAEGQALFNQGRFREAVAKYLAAYKLQPVGGILYNIAFIYDRKLDEIELARDYYRRYVHAPDAEAQTRLSAFERLDVLEKALADRDTKVTPAPVPPPVEPPPPKGISTQRTLAYVALGAGALSLATGTTFGLLSMSSQSDLDDSKDDNLSTRQGYRDDAESQALAADIAFGFGLAAIGAGVALYLLEPEPAGQATLSVVPSPEGVTLTGRF